ncbi:DUF4238 domain-containing protein [Actinomadura sp. 7K534]|uniref:DUF4238 domain-containing protein n=1 Tax=Actinomadura sp. 7K534 TaxID=2530366 RepID=UPI001047C46E|nr:DUF4238 domain-containing protein [Actinomadura sp. 7K534]TDB96911.1 DUF4238 domain-containing protein [Actinomadura sp. 7K534]
MPEQARRHHVVSKFYLRYFADERDRVTTIMLPGERTFTQNIANASVQTDFYTVIDNDGHESDLAEQALSQIETLAADAWRELAAGVWPLPEKHRVAMAAWLALQLLRGSGVRNSMSEIATHALLLETITGGRQRVREALDAAGEPADDETVDREWVDFFKNPLRAQVHANHHVQHLAQMLPRVTQSLLDRSWLLTVFQRKTLATSDHPVFVVPNDDATRMGMGTGVENATVLHAPMTRRHSLAMYLPSAVPPEISPHGADIRVAGVAAVALFSNSCAVNSARRFLFHHPKDTPLAGFDLPQPREREVAVTAQLWRWIPENDRQVLLDAEFGPDDLNALIEGMF